MHPGANGGMPKTTHQVSEVALPPGTPRWVTRELIATTLKTWQPYYTEELSPDDALEMILNVGRMTELVNQMERRNEGNV